MAKKQKKHVPTNLLDPARGVIELNKKFCVVTEGGKVRVLTFSEENGREVASYLSFADFRNLHMHQHVQVGTNRDGNAVMTSLGAYWLKHSERRQYAGVTFEPLKPLISDGKFNLWRGWAVEPKTGDWSLMQRHILDVLAAGNREHAEYILNFAAWCVQHPAEPAEVALVFRGPEGTGRGIFARALCQIFGQHGMHVSSIKHITGNFNRHLRDCCLLFADEAFWPGYRDQEGNLKRLITEPTLFIEPKGVDAFQVKNMLHVIMVSNHDWIVPASMDARRFVVLYVAEHHKQNAAWFEPLYQQMNSGGLEAMLFDLLARDLGNWHPRRIIHTEALHDQRMQSLESVKPLDAWWFMLLQEGVLPVPRGQEIHEDRFPNRAYSQDLYDHARRAIPRLRQESDVALSRLLQANGCTTFNDALRGWIFPPLDEARAHWEHEKAPHNWNDDLTTWQSRVASDAPIKVSRKPDWEAQPNGRKSVKWWQ